MEERINKPHYATRKPQNLIPLTDVKSVILFSKMVSLPSHEQNRERKLVECESLMSTRERHIGIIHYTKV